jgi:acetyltransferase-like isoleucine patch superfamily enzyme
MSKLPGYHKGNNCQVYDGAILFPNVILGDNVTVFPGAVIGRPPVSSGATTRVTKLESLIPVRIGNNCVIGANAVIYMGVEVGNNSMVCDTACIREGVVIGSHSIIAMGVTVNYNTKIGNYVKIMDNSHITGNMTIEDRVFIGMLVTTANDNLMGRKASAVASDWTEKGPHIHKFVTIGQGACILPGVEIGENAIVGANSVVTRNVAPKTLVTGIPARFKRNLRTDEILTS